MGLFDKFMKKSETSDNTVIEKEKEFDNVILETENVLNELKSFSRSMHINIEDLDFILLEYKTYFKDNGKKGSDWLQIEKKSLETIDKNSFFLNPDLLIKQIYKVEIFAKDEDYEPFALKVGIGANKLFTKVIVNVKKNNDIHYSSKLEQNLIHEINKKKVRSNIMLGIFDDELEKEVKKIVDKIKIDKFLKEDHTFVACMGLEPKKSINDNIIMHYKKKFKQEDENGKIDHAKRGYALPVNKGETVIEYIKPQKGSYGRNCQGKFIKIKEPVEKYKDMIKVTENIIIKEDDERILYIADKEGYVNEIKKNTYDIQDQMEVKEVNFKSTGSIETGTDTNVKLRIKDKNIYNDAVGAGMHIETSEIEIQGNIGAGAILKSNDIKVGGQTHKTSKIYTKSGRINVHRGYIKGKEILINRLEGGEVIGDVVKISQAIGGKVTAKKIIIKQLMSNVKLTTSLLIEIKELKGNDNKFIVDPTIEEDFMKKRDEIKQTIKALKNSLAVLPKKGLEKQAVIDKNADTIAGIRKKIKEYEKFKKQPPKAFVDKINKFEKLQQNYELIQNRIKEDKETLRQKEKELIDLQKSIFKARIINHSLWTDFNEVIFKLLSPAKNITYYPDRGENSKLIMIKPKNEENKDFQVIHRSNI